jgi:hypothetical protein
MALGGRIDPAPDLRAPLARTLRVLDRAVGKPLGAFARTHGIAQLTIVPDPWLDFVPLWALGGLAGIDVAMVSSLEPFVRERAAPPVVTRALIVSDPTEDLVAAEAEGDAVGARLAAAGVQVERLHGAQATVPTVVAALPPCELLHFAGHGRSILSEPLRSALELHPDWSRAPVASGQEFIAQFRRDDVTWQQPFDEVREATVDGVGYLRELRPGNDADVERWIDYADDRTLWASGDDGEVVADLWTAGAMTVSPPLASTRCAFLSACSSGGAFTPSSEGASGLVAALQLAGVDTVISTRWEITDAVGLLLADLFYEALCANGAAASVAARLRQAVSRLRKLTGRQAAARLRTIAAAGGDPRARAALETFASGVAAAGARPFAHPYHWAAFHVSGRGSLRLHR